MERIADLLTEELKTAFTAAGYPADKVRVSQSNRPDLCEYQCNGAMPLAKTAHKAPLAIAKEVVEHLSGSRRIDNAQAVAPGFINMDVKESYLAEYLGDMAASSRMGCDEAEDPMTIVIDYGGPNVAKPLHVGHLRSAVIGESLKRIARYCGHKVIGDVHLGDWGLQMGLIITELQERQPGLVYFDESYTGDYPQEPPFTISDLEEIYPTASKKSKEDDAYHAKALEATAQLQAGRRGYRALFQQILQVSVTDLKRNYKALNVDFDLWLGESDAQKYIPGMVKKLEDEGLAHESQGALVVDVAEESDSKEIPPCIIRKSDGASLYATTDLATIVQRMQDFHPDEILYVVDKRQQMHFTQVFRVAKKSGLVEPDTKLEFLGFGTMNGKDGKPFKTREGGVMRLEVLLNDIYEEMYRKIRENQEGRGSEESGEDEARETAKVVGLAALKYGDLSNQASKNYVFDLDRFTSFEGNTGPYILYTIVRAKSILKRYEEAGKKVDQEAFLPVNDPNVKQLELECARFNGVIADAFAETAPHKVCAYIYNLSNVFNHFYHETRILGEQDEKKQASYIALLDLTKRILETCIDVLGFSAPERM